MKLLMHIHNSVSIPFPYLLSHPSINPLPIHKSTYTNTCVLSLSLTKRCIHTPCTCVYTHTQKNRNIHNKTKDKNTYNIKLPITQTQINTVKCITTHVKRNTNMHKDTSTEK